jgi:hypothetical protein
MKHLSWRTVAFLVAVAFVCGATAHAKLNKERGNIVSTNWNKMEMDIKDPKGRVGTWHVKRDCRVRFSDQKDKFPNPKLRDLKAPMYIHFQFEEGTDLISDIEVKEVGYNADKGGPGAQQKAVVSNLDQNKGQVELLLQPNGKKTFKVDPKRQLVGIAKGDNVTVLIENRNGREVVTKITKQGGRAPGAKKLRKP